ncbi:MAG: PAS domain S-box protein [Candidatus Zixiibacteriota bacterium]
MSPESVVVIDLDGKIAFISQRCLEVFGCQNADQMIGKHALDFVVPEDREIAAKSLNLVTTTGETQNAEFMLQAFDGTRFFGEINGAALRHENGPIEGVVTIIRDITDSREAEDELRYRFEFEKVITTLSSRFITLAPTEIDANIIYALQTIGEFTGADRAYVFQISAGQQTMDNTHEWCADGIVPQIDKLQGLKLSDFSYIMDRILKRKTFFVPSVADLPNEAAVEKREFQAEGIQSLVCVPMIRQNEVVGFVGFDSVRRRKIWSQDSRTLLTIVGEILTVALERERTEKALRSSEEKYRSFVQNFQGIAYRSMMSWAPMFFHGAVEEITGYTEAEFKAGNPPWNEIIHPEDWQRISQSVKTIAQVPNATTEREYRIRRKDGQYRWILDLCQNVADSSGKPIYVQGSLYDITERKRMERVQSALFKISEATSLASNLEELLKTVHGILGTLIDTTNFYVALYDATTDHYTFPYVVDEFSDATELKPEQLKKTLTDYVRRTGEPLLADAAKDEELRLAGEVELVGEPSEIWLGAPLKTRHGTIGVVALQSYSDPNMYKESDVDLLTFVSGHIAMAIERKRSEIMLRQSEEEYRTLVETMRDGVIKVDNTEDITFANAAACNILGYDHTELEGMNLFNLVVEEDVERIFEETQKRLRKHRSRYDLKVRHKNGEIRELSISAAPDYDNNGNVVGTIGVFTDVTELNKAQMEGQRLREKLANAQRMESLGVLAGGVAHDLNNILGPLVGYPELIKRRLPADSPVKDQITKIEESAKRAAEIVSDLLTMGRRGRYEMSPVNLNQIITSYLESAEFTNIKTRYPNIDTEIHLDSSVPSVFGSSTHLSKVIMNLVLNALDAMPEGGKLSVKTECLYLEKLLLGFNNIEPGRYSIISVKDTGIGIDESDTKRIFDPFFSKKKLGKSGSGLGLSVVYAVVKDHNGYVDVRSELAKGSEFIIYLPAIEAVAPAGPEQPVYDIKGNEKILVVDDVAEQRDLAVTLLASLGYQMASASNGHEAVDYLKHESCDVLILDMIMEPNFDGLDTYREIIKTHPGQKAVIVSGFSQTDRVKEAEKLGVTKYVKKPYTMQKLGKAIREVLTSPSDADLQSLPVEKVKN